MNKKIEFKKIDAVDDISGVIEDLFEVKLDIHGGWGYNHKEAVEVDSLNMPINEFLNMFAIIRANIEMNLILEKDEKFSGINVNFLDGKQIEVDNELYDMISYEITAININDNNFFIEEYKNNYGKNEKFDLEDHFKRRKESTIIIQSDYWFKCLDNYYIKQ